MYIAYTDKYMTLHCGVYFYYVLLSQVEVGNLRFHPGFVRITPLPTTTTTTTTTPTPTPTTTTTTTTTTSVPSTTASLATDQTNSVSKTQRDSTPTTQSSQAAEQSKDKSESNSQDSVIIIAIVVTSVFLIAIVVLALCIWRRKRRAAAARDVKPSVSTFNTNALAANSCFGGKHNKGWQRFDDAPHGSMASHVSSTLPPLPVSAIFGPDRRTQGTYDYRLVLHIQHKTATSELSRTNCCQLPFSRHDIIEIIFFFFLLRSR